MPTGRDAEPICSQDAARAMALGRIVCAENADRLFHRVQFIPHAVANALPIRRCRDHVLQFVNQVAEPLLSADDLGSFGLIEWHGMSIGPVCQK